MNHREYAMKHPSFTMSERDIAALDMLASKKVSRLPKKHSNIQL